MMWVRIIGVDLHITHEVREVGLTLVLMGNYITKCDPSDIGRSLNDINGRADLGGTSVRPDTGRSDHGEAPGRPVRVPLSSLINSLTV